MNQSKKILAAMLAIPATVIVAGQVQAEEVASTFEIKNDFVGTSDVKSSTSIKTITATTKEELEEKVLLEMSSFTKGFTVTYTGPEMEKYKEHTEAIFESLKANLNGTTKIEIKDYDNTMLYGTFNNVHVKATETKTDAGVTKVELAFSFNYFADSTSSKVLDEIAADLTSGSATSILSSATPPVQKVKAVHDYIINKSYILPSNHSVTNLVLKDSGSSHAYALWTYKLLAAADINVRYVSGMSNGELHSWNLVEIGGKWYHLDITDNDNSVKGSKDIKYRYFLADDKTIGGREIYYGGIKDVKWGEEFKAFENIVNPAQADKAMYYANGASNSELLRLDLENPSKAPTPIITDATSGYGKILHYELTSSDSTTITTSEYLYFINDAVGKYLYQYNIDSKELQLIIKEPIKSISISGDRLTYIPISGTSNSILLNQHKNFNQQEADKVIKAIDELTGSDKNKVMAARQLYNALTPEQQALVKNIDKLKEFEKQLANSDADVERVIKQINDLNILELSYIQKVKDAKLAFDDSLSQEQQSLIYNKLLLEAALAKVNEAEQLNNEISEIVVEVDEPFKEDPNFIKNIESVMTKYEDLLPSLKVAIKYEQKAFMEKYSATAVQLRNELQSFINEVNIINENALNYLTLMESIEIKYNALLISQDSLLTDLQRNKIETNITKAKNMNADITKFNDYMATVSSGDTAQIKLTPEVISNMKAADALYKSMKPSQKDKIDPNDVTRLKEIMLLISGIENDPQIGIVQAMIEKLDHTKLTMDKLINDVEAAQRAFDGLGTDKQAMIPQSIINNLKKYNSAINNIETIVNDIQIKINTLTKESEETIINEIKAEYNNLIEIHQHYVDITKLKEQEARIQLEKDKALAQSVIDEISALSDDSTYEQVQPVYAQYDKLTGNVKSHVTNAQRLLDLWVKVSKDKEAIQAAIDHVNKLIEELSLKSKKEDFQKAQEAYDNLPPTSKELVKDYGKIERLLKELDDKETELADKEAARLVEEKINALNDESTPTAIAEVRAAYEALNENAKKLVSKKMLDLLVFYENSMKEQADQAKKEAQVIIDRINRITNSYTEAQIKDVRLAYNALSDLAKTFVTNLQKLIDAEGYILYQNTVVKEAKLQAAAFDAYMANISRTSTTAEIAKARAYYNSLSYEAKRHVKTYEKLRRLETMWNDTDYLGLIFTYYPDYINAIKPGGIELEKPVYDSLYIPDDSNSFAYFEPDATWSPYEEMAYYNGRYTTKIEASQVKNVVDKTMMLTAEGIEILIPTADIKGTSATVGVSMSVDNNKLVISFTEGQATKVFSDFVEIRIPMRTLGGNSSMAVQRTDSNGTTPASYKVEGSNFVIRTKIGGTFTASTSTTKYSDLASASTSAAGIRELAKRGITYSTSGKAVIPNKNVSRADVATILAKALDVSSTKATKYTDLKSTVPSRYVQGLLEAGVMSGVTAQQFSPHSAVSRQEAAIIIANMYRYLNQDLSLAYNELKTNFRDVSHLTYEARQSIAILELFGVVDGTASRNFNPEQKLTRAQFAEMLYKALNVIEYL